jgi:predicted benzoate:H+ symporter BenE
MYPNYLSGGAVTTVSANYSATKDDWLILATTTAGNFTITLPDPSGLSGKTWIIKKPLAGHQVTIATATAAQIDGSDTHTQTSRHSYDVITTDGVQFYIIAEGH